MKDTVMFSPPQPPLLTPNFYNMRRQSSIDWLLSIKANPFERYHDPETGQEEDFYLHIMKAMPKPIAETDWELARMRSYSDDLTTRIAAAKNRH